MPIVRRYREDEVSKINSKSDLNRAVANALHPEPPASERRAIHESGVWRWVPEKVCMCATCLVSAFGVSHGRPAHWEPADFCGDPVASYALEQKMKAAGYALSMVDYGDAYGWRVQFGHSLRTNDTVWHHDRLAAVALAALRALGVEFELVEGWDTK